METLNTADVSNSYLKLLPDEILLKILEQLNTVDVFHFCECYTQYEYFFGDKKLSSVMDLSKKSGFKKDYSLANIIEKFNPELVTVLNLTNIYWIIKTEMRKCLKKFKNLEELYLIGTRVGISKGDGESYRSDKLRRLAITIEDKDLEDSQARFFPNIESLCLQILSKKDYTFQYRLQCLIKKLKELTELWVHDMTNSYPLDYDHLAYTGSHLRIFAFKALSSMFSDLKFKGLTKVYVSEKSGRDVYYEKLGVVKPDPLSLAVSPAWKVLNELHVGAPYGLSDAKKLHYGIADINKIEFKELNFMHHMSSCCPRYITAIKDIVRRIFQKHHSVILSNQHMSLCERYGECTAMLPDRIIHQVFEECRKNNCICPYISQFL